MKKLTLAVSLLLALTACQQSQEAQQSNQTIQEISSTHSEENNSASLDNTSADTTPNSGSAFLMEEIVGKSDYSTLTLPADLPQDLNQGIEDYYTNKLGQEEKEINFKQIENKSLENIRKFIQLDDDLAKLKVKIDQVSLKIQGDTLYVPRLIIPMTYKDAEKKAKDNDTRLINHALTELGNHLVLIAYYNPQDKTVTPMHLVNSKHSLFYYEPK